MSTAEPVMESPSKRVRAEREAEQTTAIVEPEQQPDSSGQSSTGTPRSVYHSYIMLNRYDCRVAGENREEKGGCQLGGSDGTGIFIQPFELVFNEL